MVFHYKIQHIKEAGFAVCMTNTEVKDDSEFHLTESLVS